MSTTTDTILSDYPNANPTNITQLVESLGEEGARVVLTAIHGAPREPITPPRIPRNLWSPKHDAPDRDEVI